MSESKCTVIKESVTTEYIREIRENQHNVIENAAQNKKDTNATALSKAQKGMEEYLKAQGYVKVEIGAKDV